MISVWLCVVAGLYLVAAPFLTNTSNFLSSLLFKVIPFFIGVLLLFIAARDAGWMVHV